MMGKAKHGVDVVFGVTPMTEQEIARAVLVDPDAWSRWQHIWVDDETLARLQVGPVPVERNGYDTFMELAPHRFWVDGADGRFYAMHRDPYGVMRGQPCGTRDDAESVIAHWRATRTGPS